jgi:hypothetical protein
LNTDSGKSKKVFSLKPESVFNLNQNRCSVLIRMGVQVEPEYATIKESADLSAKGSVSDLCYTNYSQTIITKADRSND